MSMVGLTGVWQSYNCNEDDDYLRNKYVKLWSLASDIANNVLSDLNDEYQKEYGEMNGDEFNTMLYDYWISRKLTEIVNNEIKDRDFIIAYDPISGVVPTLTNRERTFWLRFMPSVPVA